MTRKLWGIPLSALWFAAMIVFIGSMPWAEAREAATDAAFAAATGQGGLSAFDGIMMAVISAAMAAGAVLALLAYGRGSRVSR